MSAVVSPSALPRRARPREAILDAFLQRLRAIDPRQPPDTTRGDAAYATALAEAPQAVPHLPVPRDDRFRRIVAGSLILHAAMLLLLLWHNSQTPPAPQDIAVELVQMPAAKPVPKPVPKPQPGQRKEHNKPRTAARGSSRPHTTTREVEKPGPMPALALPGADVAGADVVAYPQLVLSQVAKAKKEGRYIGIPGFAGVAFRLGDDGNLVSVKLVRPSGDPSLDIEAVAMVKRGAPYPPPPPGGRRDYAITLVFSARS